MRYFPMIILCLLVCLTYFPSCVEPFEPEVAEYESTLVVDALFSDSDSASQVTITRSLGLTEDDLFYIDNATVVIEDDQGGSATLQQISPGVYVTDPAIYKGEIGKSYRLLINAEGNSFESNWQLMKPSPPIGTIDYKIEEIIPNDPERQPIRGVQIYLDTEDPENATRFYRWEWIETFIYINPHPPRIRVEYGGTPRNRTAEFSDIERSEFAGWNCWKTNPSREIIIASTENLTVDKIEDFPIHFVDNTTPRLYLRYSMLIRQYAISKDYHNFLRKVEQLNETTGSLFDPIPNEVFGNIKSVDGKNIPVLGYFGVGGVSEKRIFINRADLDVPLGPPSGPECRVDTVTVGDFPALYNKTELGRGILFDYHFSDITLQIIGYLLTMEPCAFCESNGASKIRPDFW